MKKAMVRKQIYLTAEQNDQLRTAAARERRTEAEILREALDRHLGQPGRAGSPVDDDALWDIVGIASSDEGGDLSERADDVLYGAGGA